MDFWMNFYFKFSIEMLNLNRIESFSLFLINFGLILRSFWFLQKIQDGSHEINMTLSWRHRMLINHRRQNGGRGNLTPLDFLTLNFCSLTDYQKLRHNCSKFVKTSFDPN